VVPAVLVNAPLGMTHLNDGRLADLAPTILDLLGLPRPKEMTGRSLLRPAASEAGTPETAERRAAG
ncbi:MAG: 2,3-bisphosphoglycerate-independent phosphoglycerate mutase, partial [Rhodospirillaceae bacterium]